MSDKAHFQLCGKVNKQNNQYWSAAKPHVLHGKPLHSEKGIWFSLMCPAEERSMCIQYMLTPMLFIWHAQVDRLVLLLYI
jgi:hypothetical protein